MHCQNGSAVAASEMSAQGRFLSEALEQPPGRNRETPQAQTKGAQRKYELFLFSIHGHDAGAAETKVVLQRDLRPFHLTFVGGTAKLPDKLSALG